jgi:hypothetical protein
MGLASKSWIKLWLSLLLIFVFILFIKFSKKSGACSVTGFIDIGDDMTMQQKVVQWAEKRKMLNAP